MTGKREDEYSEQISYDQQTTSKGKIWNPKQKPIKTVSKTTPKFYANKSKAKNTQKAEYLIQQANKIIEDSMI